jgi:hypothetical protein
MRFMIMHRTNAHWEAGAIPDGKLLARVGALIQRLATAGILEGAEGLRPSSEGVRLVSSSGTRSIIQGPLDGTGDVPAGFTIVGARSMDEAVEWATRQQDIFGDGEIDIRPVTEPWDIGLAEAPADISTRRYMILRKATQSIEAGEAPTRSQQQALASVIDEASSRGAHVTSETMRPTRRGRRYKNSQEGIRVSDGPFAESKELIGGYVIVSAASLEEADGWAREYMRAVDADEVELRELE